MEAGRMAVGSSGAQRLDPFSLPVRFAAADEAADERLRIVDLHRERVVFRRAVRGMRMTLSLPVNAFRGVAIRLLPDADKIPSAIAVVLEHGDPALSLPLFASTGSDDVLAEWQSWGLVLGLPLLVVEGDGSLREPFARLGALRVDPPTSRRRRRNAIARRRPVRLLRRRPVAIPATPTVHRDEREIIARN
jgi:Family of unknown function (DUF6101)